MKRTLLIAATVLMLAGCGTMAGDRAISGGLIGAGVGAVTGGVGVVVGAALGAGAGYVIKPEDINLGAPIWRR